LIDLATNSQFNVTRMELFVSKIPCSKRENIGSSAFMIDGYDDIFPEGCGPKLVKLSGLLPNINWIICYEKDSSGSPVGADTKNTCWSSMGWITHLYFKCCQPVLCIESLIDVS
jgi:hypothetical protein